MFAIFCKLKKITKLVPGTDVMIFKIFLPKNLAKIFAFFAQTTVSFCKNCYHNIGFWEKRQFFAENWKKSPKIVIITSTPGSVIISKNKFETCSRMSDVCNYLFGVFVEKFFHLKMEVFFLNKLWRSSPKKKSLMPLELGKQRTQQLIWISWNLEKEKVGKVTTKLYILQEWPWGFF
jgi:hypothetical protein